MSLPDSQLLILYYLNSICAFTLHINAFIWEKSFFISFCFVVVRRFFINVLTCMGTFVRWDSTTTKLGWWVFSYLITNIKYLIVVWLYKIYHPNCLIRLTFFEFLFLSTQIDPRRTFFIQIDWDSILMSFTVNIFKTWFDQKTKYLQKWKTMDLFVRSDIYIAIIK